MTPNRVGSLTHLRDRLTSTGTGKWAQGNLRRFNKAKCDVLHLGWAIPGIHRLRMKGFRAALPTRT